MLIFLKLGGSLITEKNHPYTPRPGRIADLAVQIMEALRENPDLRLVLGHGSGSFGHEAAQKYNTRKGVAGQDGWHGFAEVWYQASTLNRILIDSLHRVGLPVLTISPAASITAHDGKVFIWDIFPLQTALDNGLLPVIHGDVVFDDVRGGTILSTENLFSHLARHLKPQRILLAGLEAGVWENFPNRTCLIRDITPEHFARQIASLGGAAGADVTGGMKSKVLEMLTLVEQVPGLEVQIFSGEDPDAVRLTLLGIKPGTCLHC